VNLLILLKSSQRFVFKYDDNPRSLQRLITELAAFASDSEIDDFTWYDAAKLSDAARQSAGAKQ
tara:strand:- start:602 stop:793 length:192 start_codon:yes stop_codon:yes gene_type:complete